MGAGPEVCCISKLGKAGPVGEREGGGDRRGVKAGQSEPRKSTQLGWKPRGRDAEKRCEDELQGEEINGVPEQQSEEWRESL